ncbi:hypothetical protein HJFPF1_00008 [Paramyrothecium foliicola]|nr:hypothetical protein HJFPF1_00008 [Paramyrothecium foliicola]
MELKVRPQRGNIDRSVVATGVASTQVALAHDVWQHIDQTLLMGLDDSKHWRYSRGPTAKRQECSSQILSVRSSVTREKQEGQEKANEGDET